VKKAAREGCLMLVIAPEWPGPQYPWCAALCAMCPKRWELPQDRPVYLRGGGHGPDACPQVEDMGLPVGFDGGAAGTNAATSPAPAHPPTVGPQVSETPPDQDPGAQLMVAHRHTDTLPLRSRRDVPRSHPTGPPGGAPTTRSAAKPRLWGVNLGGVTPFTKIFSPTGARRA